MGLSNKIPKLPHIRQDCVRWGLRATRHLTTEFISASLQMWVARLLMLMLRDDCRHNGLSITATPGGERSHDRVRTAGPHSHQGEEHPAPVPVLVSPVVQSAETYLRSSARCSCWWGWGSTCLWSGCRTLQTTGYRSRRPPRSHRAARWWHRRLEDITDTTTLKLDIPSCVCVCVSVCVSFWPAFLRHMFMSQTSLQVLVSGSYTSTLFLTRGPSCPPAANSWPLSTPTPGPDTGGGSGVNTDTWKCDTFWFNTSQRWESGCWCFCRNWYKTNKLYYKFILSLHFHAVNRENTGLSYNSESVSLILVCTITHKVH